MDYVRICNSEGYRIEDLAPKEKFAMENINFLMEQIEEQEDAVIDSCVEETGSGVLDTILEQYAGVVFDRIMNWMHIESLELQIYFAENKEDAKIDVG